MIIIWIVQKLADIIILAMLAVAVLSWFANPYKLGPNHPVVRIYYTLNRLIEPITRPAKKLLSRFNTGPVDLSLFVTMIFVYIARRIIIQILVIILQ
jgi:YggT family protein